MLAEAVLGDGDVNATEEPGDWFAIAMSNTTKAQVYEACMNVTPSTGASSQGSQSGQNWIWGNYNTTRYNHIMQPNSRSCVRASSQIDKLSGWSIVNDNGGATSASSRHPGGVNIAMADGSTRFVKDDINIYVWWAMASISGDEVIAEDD